MQNENEEYLKTERIFGYIKRIVPFYPLIWIILIALSVIIFFYILLLMNVNKGTPPTMYCKSNLKNIGIAFALYTNENTDINNYTTPSFPTQDKWCDLISEYVGRDETYRCPSAKLLEGKTCTYVINSNLYELRSPVPRDMVLAFEGPVGWNLAGGSEMMVFRHGKKDKKCNIVLGDYSLTEVNKTEAKKLKWKP